MATIKETLKKHMAKGKGAHPDADVKKMAKGGKTNADMKKYGRNIAKIMNQRSAGRGR
jgi:gluconate kinase